MHKFMTTVREDVLMLGIPFLMKGLEFILKQVREWWNIRNMFCRT
jgi:hypothetical protein